MASSSVPSLLLMVQREPQHAMWHHLALSQGKVMPHGVFFCSFTASDGSEGTTARHVASPCSVTGHPTLSSSDGSEGTTARHVASPCSVTGHPTLSSSDGSEGTTACHVASPCSVTGHHGFRSKEVRRARKHNID